MLSNKSSLWLTAGIVFSCAFFILALQPSPVLAWLGRSVQEQQSDSAAEATPPASSAPAQAPSQSEAQRRAPEPFVLIDASHGGEDKGAVFSNKLAEKDITLALARELRKELAERGVAAKMLREGDVSIALDRRAEIANEPHTVLYIALHAGPPGRGVRVYAPMVTAPQKPSGRFLVWESAQAQSQERSRKIAQAVVNELKRKEIQVMLLESSLRPLNNIVPPAIAVELAPDPGNARSLESEKLHGAVASAIAAAVAQSKNTTGGRP